MSRLIFSKIERTHVRCYVIHASIRPSLLGCGKNGFGGAAACGSFGPISSASNFSCCRNVRIISGDGGGVFLAVSSDGSRCEKLKMKIKIQTAAKPVQIRRQGQISSRNESRMAFASAAANVNSRTGCFRRLTSAAASTASRRMVSSFGVAERCRFNKISRGVFMLLFWQGASLRARRHWRADERRAGDCPPYLCVFAPLC